MQCNILLNMLRADQDECPGPALIDLHNVKTALGSKKQPSCIIMAQKPQMLHSTSQPNSVKIPCVFHLLLQSFYGAQDKFTIKKLAAGQPYHRPTNTSCSSTCRTKEWEWNGLSGFAERRDGIIWRGKKQKYSDPASRRISGIFYRFHTCSLA